MAGTTGAAKVLGVVVVAVGSGSRLWRPGRRSPVNVLSSLD